MVLFMAMYTMTDLLESRRIYELQPKQLWSRNVNFNVVLVLIMIMANVVVMMQMLLFVGNEVQSIIPVDGRLGLVVFGRRVGGSDTDTSIYTHRRRH